MSELDEPFFSRPLSLLQKVIDIEFTTPARPDECCGFGGTFYLTEEPVSARMGYDKAQFSQVCAPRRADHQTPGLRYRDVT
ncbi:putative Fe-S oxidoreductase [Cupriavidus basilensis OR16]|uniref:Putative Fe-S oxidoreductase n=1 Tax=Cupriavidus basilensis OR16 TaxID=1127483 RepID=H1S239_9BURK|nr:(Fe-S)-binding protein [Cupriavidus basilensis]EHP43405.1 putative Fe-S oxidoreductase [Cupriavidus basilensis OR16]